MGKDTLNDQTLTGMHPDLAAGGCTPAVRQRSRAIACAWTLLLINTLGFTSSVNSIVPLDPRIAQAITIASLFVSFTMALVANPRLKILPNVFLLLLSLMVMASIASTIGAGGSAGQLLRCFRFMVFVATLWLLTPWWQLHFKLARITIRFLAMMLLLVLVGLVASPEAAMWSGSGRLSGVLWPMTPTLVGQYAAVIVGLTTISGLMRLISFRETVILALVGAVCLLMSHTRTALAGLVAGLLCALLPMVVVSRRIRWALGAAFGGATAAWLLFAEPIWTWLRRGQGNDALTSLTGRQSVWNGLLGEDRDLRSYLLGAGLSDKTYNGLPIDSGWLAIYWEQGYLGVVIATAMFLCLTLTVLTRQPSPARMCAVFLIVFSFVSSYTEVGIGSPSAYLLYLAVAAALLRTCKPRGVRFQKVGGGVDENNGGAQ